MYKKMAGAFILFVALFTVLSIRIVYLANFTDLMETAQNQASYRLTIGTARGSIYDRNYNNMVNNETVYKAVVFPEPNVIDTVLSLDPTLTRTQVADLISEGKPFVINANQTSVDQENIRIFQQKQRYSDQGLAPHIIGYLNGDGNGVTGIEEAYNDLLQTYTSETQLVFAVDGLGRYLKGDQTKIALEGNDQGGVVLTLDCAMQDLVQKIGGQKINKGAVMVFDANSAEILACASFPSYSQNAVQDYLNDEQNTPLINRNLYAYNVGSTFKIATAAAALEHGISPSTTYHCTGKIDVSGQIFKCHHRNGHGTLSMSQALVLSCNPYYINLSQMVGGGELLHMASDLGFGKKVTLADTIVAAAGTLPTPEQLQKPAELANFGFGQGKLTANSLQVSQLVLSVVNQGRVKTPTLVLGTTEDGETLTKTDGGQDAEVIAMSEETAQQLHDYLVQVVEAPENASAKPNQTSAGGKSATAQTGKYDDNGVEICQTWFTGFFPAEDPKYVVTVLVEGGDTGSATAGPVFAQIADAITLLNR